MKITLSKHVIYNKIPASRKEEIYWDRKGTRLGVRVYKPVGGDDFRQRAWVVGYQFASKPQRITLGLVCRHRLDWAANQAQEVHLQVAQGIDPKEYRRGEQERVREESKLTVQALAEMYLSLHFGTKLNPEPGEDRGKKSANEARRVWNEFALPKFGPNKLVANVTTTEIDEMIADAPAPSTGRRIRNFTRAAFNHAEKWGFIPPSKPNWKNPADAAKTIKVNQREVVINQGEYVRAVAETEKILEEVRTHPKFALTLQRQCLIVLLIAESGRRNNEIQGLEWKNIDIRGRMVTLPKTKAGKLQTFALSDRAVELLHKAKDLAGDNPFVFPSNAVTTPLREVKTVWNWVRERANIRQGVDLYSMRHFFISNSADAGVALEDTSKHVGHTKLETTMIYMRRGNKKGVVAAQAMSDHLNNLREEAAECRLKAG